MCFVFGVETSYQCPKPATVVSVYQVADFMNDDIVDHFVRSHDQMAVKVEVVF